MTKEAIAHYEAALKEAFPRGATGDVFHHWNEARKATQQAPVGVECDCPYLNIHDAVVRDHDKAISLLKQCLDEMHYAGWNKPTADQQGRWNVFSTVLDYLHPTIQGDKS